MSNITIGISCGDINGIGLEVILKSIGLKNIGKKFKTSVYGSSKVIAYHKNIITEENIQFHSIEAAAEAQAERINVVNCEHNAREAGQSRRRMCKKSPRTSRERPPGR